MKTIDQITQSHLSVFVFDNENHNPIKRMPMYAEIAAIGKRIPVKIDANNIDIVDDIFYDRESKTWFVEALERYVNAIFFNNLGHEERSNFILKLVDKIVSQIEELPNPTRENKKSIVFETVKKVALDLNFPEPEPQSEFETLSAFPLGMLATDHVGYLSYSLKNVPRNPFPMYNNLQYAVYLYPMGKEAARIDALHQARITPDVIFAKLEIQKPVFEANLRALNLPAMQNPDLADWYMSPGSFAAIPSALIGAEGCENLFPANFATQEFRFRQVIRLNDKPNGYPDFPNTYKFGYVDEYKVSLIPIGHSLGEIKYSLPLAPGESVKLAIIDWSRTDSTVRTEDTQFAEKLMHDTHRDRSITETVQSALNEWQRGGNVQGGANVSLFGIISIGGGGGYTTSSGSRELAGSTTQKLTDSFSQASSALREFHSTVVVQTKQEEKQNIQTRTFTNYNHSHTLTILYYEILRHFRIVTEWVNRKPVALLPYTKIDLNNSEEIIKYKYLLKPLLLDKSLDVGFDSLEKLNSIEHDRIINPIITTPAPLNQREYRFWTINFSFEVGNGDWESSAPMFMQAVLANGSVIWLSYMGNRDINNQDELFNNTGRKVNILLNPDQAIPWKDLRSFQIWTNNNDNAGIDNAGFTATGNFPGNIVLRQYGPVNLKFIDSNTPQQITTNVHGPDFPAPTPPPSPSQLLTIQENYAIKKLKKHLSEFNDYYYNRIIYLNKDVNANAAAFESINWGNGPEKIIDNIEPLALEVFGSFIAYPLIEDNNLRKDKLNQIFEAILSDDPILHEWAINEIKALDEGDFDVIVTKSIQGKAKTEKLISLPTRGIFAEGKLGHCNISEEIDETRFWKWEEHPIPIQAPDINPINAINPQPVQQNVQPSPMPSPSINIVSPTAAPDPQGLTEALKVLATPNIFRDMSGRQEVADLLKKLADENISITEAKNKADEIRNKHGEQLDKQQKDYELGKSKEENSQIGKIVDKITEPPVTNTPSTKIAEASKAIDAGKQLSPNNRKQIDAAATKKIVEALKPDKFFTINISANWGGYASFGKMNNTIMDFKLNCGNAGQFPYPYQITELQSGSVSMSGVNRELNNGNIEISISSQGYHLPNLGRQSLKFPGKDIGGINIPPVEVPITPTLLDTIQPVLEVTRGFNIPADKNIMLLGIVAKIVLIKKIPIKVTVSSEANASAELPVKISGEMDQFAKVGIDIAPKITGAVKVGASIEVTYDLEFLGIEPGLNLDISYS